MFLYTLWKLDFFTDRINIKYNNVLYAFNIKHYTRKICFKLYKSLFSKRIYNFPYLNWCILPMTFQNYQFKHFRLHMDLCTLLNSTTIYILFLLRLVRIILHQSNCSLRNRSNESLILNQDKGMTTTTEADSLKSLMQIEFKCSISNLEMDLDISLL